MDACICMCVVVHVFVFVWLCLLQGGRRGRGRGGGYNGSERQEEGSSKPWSVAKSSGAGAAQEEENWD